MEKGILAGILKLPTIRIGLIVLLRRVLCLTITTKK